MIANRTKEQMLGRRAALLSIIRNDFSLGGEKKTDRCHSCVIDSRKRENTNSPKEGKTLALRNRKTLTSKQEKMLTLRNRKTPI